MVTEAPGALTVRSSAALGTVSLASAIIMGANSSLFLALPDIGRTFTATVTGLQWVLDGYAVVLAALLLPAGGLGDRFGRRRLLQAGLVVFAAGAVAFGLCASTGWGITWRVVMGVGAALAFPSTLATITATFPASRRSHGIAVWSMSAIVGSFGGLVVSALLLEVFSWRSIEWTFAGLALVTAALSAATVTESRVDASPAADVRGAVLALVGVGGLVAGIIESPTRHLTSPFVLASLALGAAAIGAFLVWELRVTHPLLDVRAITGGETVASTLALLATYLLCFGQVSVSTPYLSTIRRLGPLATAGTLLCYALLLVPIVIASGVFARHLVRPVAVMLGLVGMALADEAMALLTPDTGLWAWCGCAVVFGVGLGVVQAPATETLVSSLPDEQQGVASAVNDVTRELGAALGIAIAGAVLTGTAGHTGDPAADFMTGFRTSLLAQAVVPFAIALVAFALTRGRSRPPLLVAAGAG